MEIKDLAEIDRHNLDQAIEEHPHYFFGVSSNLVEKKRLYREAEFALERVDAELTLYYREHATDKPTVDKIKSLVITDSRHIVRLNEFLAAAYERDRAYQDVAVLETRERAIRSLIALHGSQYWTKPDEPFDRMRPPGMG